MRICELFFTVKVATFSSSRTFKRACFDETYFFISGYKR